MALRKFSIKWSAARKQKFRKWLLIGVFTIAGPIVIILFKTPGSNPEMPPIITVASDVDNPLPLTISVDDDFETSGRIDLYPLGKYKWTNLNITFSPEVTDIEIPQKSDSLKILRPGSNYMLKKYPEGPTQFFIKKDTFDLMLRNNNYGTDIYNTAITFKLKDVMINHSFSNKSLVMFYLSMGAKDSLAKHRTVDINLETPFDLTLNSSIPSPERILVINKRLNYDLRISASDSGLLFNFTDSGHEIFEEITMFIVSSVFGFFSGMLIEQLLKNKIPKNQ